MKEYQGIVVVGQENEPESRFSARLSEFWTVILRQHPEQFEGIYAEASEFDSNGNRPTRQYAVDPGVVDFLRELLSGAGIGLMPVDPDETFTRYEAVAPDWWQIEH